MRYEAIMFDLDGTLLPMDNDYFLKGYFHLLAQVGIACGYDEKLFLEAMNRGVYAMIVNDGSCRNEVRFWKAAAELLGKKIHYRKHRFDLFYKTDFHKAKKFTEPTPFAETALSLARKRADKVVLATSPLFPTEAVNARISWAGLRPGQFDWITDYANSSTCKPNPQYYLETAGKLGVDPRKCLMIGNNVQEDIIPARQTGMDTFLVTDCLINRTGEEPEGPQGSMEALLEYLRK